MGTSIIPIDLSTAVVGSTGDINIPTVTSEEGYHLLLFNESGCGLKLRFYESGDTDNIPAGGWRKYPLIPGEDTITWTVIYTLPNAPVSLLIGTIYKPGEKVPDVGTLGNSPISIGGTVNTSSVQTLSNETSVLGTKIIDIGTLTIGDLLDIFNDHFLWKVQQAGVAHQVLAGNTSGVPLQIGQAGDISEVLGNMKVDGTLESVGAATLDSTLDVTGIITANNDINFGANNLHIVGKDSGGTARQILYLDSGNTTILRMGGSQKISFQDNTGAEQAKVDTSGVVIGTGNIITLEDGSHFKRLHAFSGTGDGTFNTNAGATPDMLAFDPCTVSGSSQTIGGTLASSSVIKTGGGLAWNGTATVHG